MSDTSPLRLVWSGSARQSCSDAPMTQELIETILRRIPEQLNLREHSGRELRVTAGNESRGLSLAVTFIPDFDRGILRIRDVEVLDNSEEVSSRQPPPIARSTTGLAARIAGVSRPHLHDEWQSLLAGSPEDGMSLSSARQRVLALGFLVAAIRMRLHDFGRPAWRPVDWLLRVPARTNAFITAVVGAQAVYIVGDGGVTALATDVWEPCGIAGAALFVLARWLRGVRGIELAAPEDERADQ
ncbi:hypothetical protein [Streptomyces sp. NRRL B-1140]|uniref:hypothetical protein n=1 Tax=Streptomyces sp. NRRL B-1140 TaxID=1415549 RepID=UPI000A9698E3|nr:hypothetical protein [Streptomyces sp. NRRL B-1140]